MSFRIADLIGDKVLNSTDSGSFNLNKTQTDKGGILKDKVIVSSTSEDLNATANIPRTFSEDYSSLNHRIRSATNSSNGPINLVNHSSNTNPFLNHIPAASKLGLSSFDDYASKLYSNMYYDQLYLSTPGLITPANSGVVNYAANGLDKALLSTYPALYSRSRPGWPTGLYPAPSQSITHHALSPFLYSPLVYSHYSKRKGGQVRFTTSQTDTLEKRFQSHKYLSPEDRRVLAESLKLSDRQVKTWFQNRRAKWRRCHDGSEKQSEAMDCHSSDSEPEQIRCLSPDLQLNIAD